MSVAEKVYLRAARLRSRLSTSAPLVRSDATQLTATVVAVDDLGAGMRRVTCESPDLRTFVPLGPDEYVGLLMPPAGRPPGPPRQRPGR